MHHRNLGNSGVKVSPLCLGAMTFGEADEQSFMHGVGATESTSLAIMDRALEAGINFIDTADVYGQDGLSERVLGRWLKDRGVRDQIVLATKFRFRMGDGANDAGASRYHIVRAVEASLRRLNTERIDLYQIHMQDTATPIEETLRALDSLIAQGKVAYIGASNYLAYRLSDAIWTSRLHGLERFVTLQAQYSLLVRDLEREHIPLLKHQGLGLLPWSPLAGGFLSGKYRRSQTAPPGSRLEKWQARYEALDQERNWSILEAVQSVAEQAGLTVAQTALAWLLHQSAVTSVIFGARSVEQLDENLRAADAFLSGEQLATLDNAAKLELGYPYEFIRNVQSAW